MHGRGHSVTTVASIAAALLAIGLGGTAPTAAASTYVVGSPLTADFSSALVIFQKRATIANLTLPEPGAYTVSPVDGTITGWRVITEEGDFLSLRVLQPRPDGTYTAISTSSTASTSGEGLESFATNQPIAAGQAIGLEAANSNEKVPAAAVTGVGNAYWKTFLADGSTQAPELFTKPGDVAEVPFDAIVVARPAVNLLGTASGSVRGHIEVKIAGRNLDGATAVSFGGVPAGFTVVSENLIVATSPPFSKPGSVDITVTSPGGQSATTEADRFTYIANCVVPKLKGKSLKTARKLLKRAKCALGKVSGPKSPDAQVAKQSSKPGSVLPAGAKVGVGLG